MKIESHNRGSRAVLEFKVIELALPEGKPIPIEGVVDLVKVRLSHANDCTAKVVAKSSDMFDVVIEANAIVDKEQVRRRVETVGVLEIVPLTSRVPDSSRQERRIHEESAYSDEWAPVHPDCGHTAPIGRDFVTRVLEPSSWESAKWPYYVSIYSRRVVLRNQDFESIESEAATFPTISKMRIGLNATGESKLQDFPPGFVDRTGKNPSGLYSGLLLDGWLLATIFPLGLSQSDAIRFTVPYAPSACEDVVIAALHPMQGYACKLVSAPTSR